VTGSGADRPAMDRVTTRPLTSQGRDSPLLSPFLLFFFSSFLLFSFSSFPSLVSLVLSSPGFLDGPAGQAPGQGRLGQGHRGRSGPAGQALGQGHGPWSATLPLTSCLLAMAGLDLVAGHA